MKALIASLAAVALTGCAVYGGTPYGSAGVVYGGTPSTATTCLTSFKARFTVV